MGRMRRAGERALGFVAGEVAPVWIGAQRRAYRRVTRPLSEEERALYAPWFGGELLGAVRVAEVERIDPVAGLGRWAERRAAALGVRVGAGLGLGTGPVGIALIDTVVLADTALPAGKIDRDELLFHELVHIAQYRVLGLRGFARAYLRGWGRGGCDYREIPLEWEAENFTERFRRGERFGVEAAVLRRIRGG